MNIVRATLAWAAVAASVSYAAEGIEWHTDVAEAVKAATEKNLPLMVFVTSSHCPYCVKMKSQTFSNAALATEINKRFVAVQVDRGSNAEFERRAAVRAYPTTLILRADQAELGRILGYVSPQQLTAGLTRAEAQFVATKTAAETTVK